MKKTRYALALAALLAASPVVAQEFNQDKLYFGAGLSSNSLSGWDDAVGFQIFGGYEFDFMLGDASTALEIGYMDSGDFEHDIPFFGTVKESASGLWITGVAALPLGQQASLLGRLGVDLGDDDGLMVGLGFGFAVSPRVDLRGEYVVRDNIDSLQFNVVYRP